MIAAGKGSEVLNPITFEEVGDQAVFNALFPGRAQGTAPITAREIHRKIYDEILVDHKAALHEMVQELATLKEDAAALAHRKTIKVHTDQLRVLLHAHDQCDGKQRERQEVTHSVRVKINICCLTPLINETDGNERKIVEKLLDIFGDPTVKGDYIEHFFQTEWPALKKHLQAELSSASSTEGARSSRRRMGKRVDDRNWFDRAPMLTRSFIIALITAATALLCVVFPPVGLAALLGSGVTVFALQVGIPAAIAVIMLVMHLGLPRSMWRHRSTLLSLSVMLLAAGLGAIVAPAMPAVLLGAMTAATWKLFAAVSFALAVPGLKLLSNRLFTGEDMFSHSGVLNLWGGALLSSLLLMPSVVVLMPGAILAFGVSVAPHILGAGVTASSPVVAMAFLQGIVASAGILFGMIAAVQTLGALLYKRSRVLIRRSSGGQTSNRRWSRLQRLGGFGLMALAPLAFIGALGFAFVTAGQMILHAGAKASAALYHLAVTHLPAPEVVYGAIGGALAVAAYPVEWLTSTSWRQKKEDLRYFQPVRPIHRDGDGYTVQVSGPERRPGETLEAYQARAHGELFGGPGGAATDKRAAEIASGTGMRT